MTDETCNSLSDSIPQNVYANDVFVDIGETEISLVFSDNFFVKGIKQSRPMVRVVLTHDNYIRMVDFWEKRAKLLRRAYKNRRPNLYSGDAEELRQAFDELYPPTDEDTAEESLETDTPGER